MINWLDVALWQVSNMAICLSFVELRRNKSNLLIVTTILIGLASACGGLYMDLN